MRGVVIRTLGVAVNVAGEDYHRENVFIVSFGGAG